ncbi:hypothetical protein HOY80DRAFT_1072583 [Tuber brumale]|nr:hypothetical protein HOY80DRAFT_1072583 [Tuber brumale]
MPNSYPGGEIRARRERLRDSNSRGNSTGGMVSRWLDAVNAADTAPTTTQFSRAGTPRELVRRTQVSEAVFQTFSPGVRDLFSIPTTPITRSPATLTFHFEPPSAFDSYDTTPNTSAPPSPSRPIHSSSGPSQEPASTQVGTGRSSWRRSRVQSEHRASGSSVLEQRFTRYSSAPGRIATESFRGVFTAGAGIQRTLGDIAPEETDAIRSFWAEIGTEARRESHDEYAYVAVPGGAGVGNVDLEEEEYMNELASELICRLEYPGITQTSVVAPAWSDVSSSTSSGSSLSSGGLAGWGFATPPPLFLDGGRAAAEITGRDSSAAGVELEGGDADSMQENPLHSLNQITNLSAPSTLPPTWVDTLAPFVFPPSPTREIPSISTFSPLGSPLAPSFTPEIYPFHNNLPRQSQELENWIAQNLVEYSHLSSTSASTSTLLDTTPPTSPGALQDPTAEDTTTTICPICYENQVTREFPCSVQGAQHGLCRPCFVAYETYCTDVMRCPLCRHEFFGSQVIVAGCEIGGEEEGVGLVDGDEGLEVGSEVDGEHEVVDEEEIEFYMSGYVF